MHTDFGGQGLAWFSLCSGSASSPAHSLGSMTLAQILLVAIVLVGCAGAFIGTAYTFRAKGFGEHYAFKQSNLETRLNKCLVGLSRRGADAVITAGEVTINNVIAECGARVKHGDVVRYNGKVQNWELIATAKERQPQVERENRSFIYLKYWKPAGITCTSDPSDPTNIIAAGKFNLLPQRLFTVGRLDKDSTGLILLTSDGRVNNALLNQKRHKEKTYLVEMDQMPSDEQVAQLSSGVVITTPIQRDNYGASGQSSRTTRTTEITARTLPCEVKRVSAYNGRNCGGKLLQVTLIEGRNRQIRRMAEAVGLNVVALHRTSFAGVTLKGITTGQWEELDEGEMKIIQRAVADQISKATD